MNKKILVYSVLLLIAIPMFASLVMAADKNESWLTESRFYGVVSPYFVPGGMGGLSGLIVGIITMVILFSIFLDVLTLVAPFSKWVMWVITIGLAIIAIMVKLNITVAGWIFKISSIIFAWAGALAGLLTVVLAIAVLIFIFFGGQWLSRWASGVRLRRRGLEGTERAVRRGQDVNANVVQSRASIGRDARGRFRRE